jgi:hypothetical protein
MIHDLFLSYSRTDQHIADRFFEIASAHGLKIWYDRFIAGGHDWREKIVEALGQSRALVIFFSEASNGSKQLVKELAIADRTDKLVVPVLIQATEPKGAYLYEMAARNWINLYPEPLSRLEALTQLLLMQLAEKSSAGARTQASVDRASPNQANDGAPSYPTPNSWFPLRSYDIPILAPVLLVGLFLALFNPGGSQGNVGLGLNTLVLLAYMGVMAVRNSRANRSIFSLKSLCSYLIIGLTLLPFGLVPAVVGGGGAPLKDIVVGMPIIALCAAVSANVLQVVLRWIFQRNLFKSRLGRPLGLGYLSGSGRARQR